MIEYWHIIFFSSCNHWIFINLKGSKQRMPNYLIGSFLQKYFPDLVKPNDDEPLSPGFT